MYRGVSLVNASDIVVTGFDVYGSEVDNPTGRIALELNGVVIGGYLIHGLKIPVSYASVRRAVEIIYNYFNPRIVLSLGLSPPRPIPSIERIALNYADTKIPDTDGIVMRNKRIVNNGPLALETSVNVGALVDYLIAQGIPVTISYHAGTYLCNYLYYLLLYKGLQRRTKVLFIHVPRTRGEALMLLKSSKTTHFVEYELLVEMIKHILKYLVFNGG